MFTITTFYDQEKTGFFEHKSVAAMHSLLRVHYCAATSVELHLSDNIDSNDIKALRALLRDIPTFGKNRKVTIRNRNLRVIANRVGQMLRAKRKEIEITFTAGLASKYELKAYNPEHLLGAFIDENIEHLPGIWIDSIVFNIEHHNNCEGYAKVLGQIWDAMPKIHV